MLIHLKLACALSSFTQAPLYKDDLVTAGYLKVPGSGYGQQQQQQAMGSFPEAAGIPGGGGGGWQQPPLPMRMIDPGMIALNPAMGAGIFNDAPLWSGAAGMGGMGEQDQQRRPYGQPPNSNVLQHPRRRQDRYEDEDNVDPRVKARKTAKHGIVGGGGAQSRIKEAVRRDRRAAAHQQVGPPGWDGRPGKKEPSWGDFPPWRERGRGPPPPMQDTPF